MPKHDRTEEMLRRMANSGRASSTYSAWFHLFNEGRYYEAHDVLEHTWLPTRDPFLKGLIQIAGGFVHLQRQQARPAHPKDGKRLRPACRLLTLGVSNVRQHGSPGGLKDTRELCSLCLDLVRRIEDSGFLVNPWFPDRLPFIRPPV